MPHLAVRPPAKTPGRAQIVSPANGKLPLKPSSQEFFRVLRLRQTPECRIGTQQHPGTRRFDSSNPKNSETRHVAVRPYSGNVQRFAPSNERFQSRADV